MKFKNYDGKLVSLKEIVSYIEKDHEYDLYVGTDSHVHNKKKVVYATCIVLHKRTKGGKIFVCKQKDTPPNSLSQRLMQETWLSLQTAFSLSEIIPKNAEIVIHLDVNPDDKFASAKDCQKLVGMVTGQGFKCHVKPDAAIAQKVADKFSK